MNKRSARLFAAVCVLLLLPLFVVQAYGASPYLTGEQSVTITGSISYGDSAVGSIVYSPNDPDTVLFIGGNRTTLSALMSGSEASAKVSDNSEAALSLDPASQSGIKKQQPIQVNITGTTIRNDTSAQQNATSTGTSAEASSTVVLFNTEDLGLFSSLRSGLHLEGPTISFPSTNNTAVPGAAAVGIMSGPPSDIPPSDTPPKYQ